MEHQVVRCFLCGGNHETTACPSCKAGVKCECGSMNTVWVSCGGYQDADALRNTPMVETNGQVMCNDCGRVWWD